MAGKSRRIRNISGNYDRVAVFIAQAAVKLEPPFLIHFVEVKVS